MLLKILKKKFTSRIVGNILWITGGIMLLSIVGLLQATDWMGMAIQFAVFMLWMLSSAFLLAIGIGMAGSNG